jgi:hypothetical protein
MKRRTDKVHRDMSEVIVNEGPLSAVAKGVQDVNETLAHHAAWTEERFERVEDRLGGLELGQQAIVESVDGLSMRVGNLEVAFVGMRADMVRMEERLVDRIDGLALTVDGLALTVNGLAVRVDKVLAFAIKDELKLAEILKDEDDRQ